MQVCDHDFFSNVPFPQSDIITMGMVLHDWGLPNKRLLIKKVMDNTQTVWMHSKLSIVDVRVCYNMEASQERLVAYSLERLEAVVEM